jgi:hypothetical protein
MTVTPHPADSPQKSGVVTDSQTPVHIEDRAVVKGAGRYPSGVTKMVPNAND